MALEKRIKAALVDSYHRNKSSAINLNHKTEEHVKMETKTG